MPGWKLPEGGGRRASEARQVRGDAAIPFRKASRCRRRESIQTGGRGDTVHMNTERERKRERETKTETRGQRNEVMSLSQGKKEKKGKAKSKKRKRQNNTQGKSAKEIQLNRSNG